MSKPKLPLIKDLQEVIKHVKKEIDEVQEDDTLPSICLTIGADCSDGDWSFQTGDNSYTGKTYGYRDWAVVSVYRRSNSHDLAIDIRNQLSDLFYQ